MPMVSVVVPTYRRPAFLAEALASLKVQTWSDLEILVCDNGADALTRDVVESAGDPRIRYLPRETNLGMMRNAIEGFRSTRGEFVAKLDDDDAFEPAALATLVGPLIDDPTLAMAFAPFDLVDAQGHPLPEETKLNESTGRAALAPGRHAPFTRLAASGAASLTCALVRRDAVDWDAVPDAVATAYDRHIVLDCARRGTGAWYEPTPLVRYRVHAGSDTVQASLRQALGSLAASEHALAAGDHVDPHHLVPGAQESAVTAARLLLREGRVPHARRVIARALRRRAHPEIARLAAVSLLPDAAATSMARRRYARYVDAADGHAPSDPWIAATAETTASDPEQTYRAE